MNTAETKLLPHDDTFVKGDTVIATGTITRKDNQAYLEAGDIATVLHVGNTSGGLQDLRLAFGCPPRCMTVLCFKGTPLKRV